MKLLVKASRNTLGFSLVELMIAISIFAIVAGGAFAALKMGFSLVDNARHHTRAGQIMQSEIERVRSLAWANLNNLPTVRTQVPIASQFGDVSYTKYTLYRSISGTGNSRRVTVEIEWEAINGRAHVKTYVTQYTRGGLYDYIQ